jgi:hypothetical protein
MKTFTLHKKIELYKGLNNISTNTVTATKI